MALHEPTDNLELDANGVQGERPMGGAHRVAPRRPAPASTNETEQTTDEALKTAERRLTRLVLDLHDGPLQDVVALGMDLRFFREQLQSVMTPGEDTRKLAGRIDDLDARLLVLAADLREIASTAQWPTFLGRPFVDAVAAEIQGFEEQTNIRVAAGLEGEFDGLTASQRIALLRVLEETLSNVRQHSSAQNVTVSMRVDGQRVYAELVDDGSGFDLDSTLVRAARLGRLGIVGMAERVRLLGGRFDLDTRPGGPTKISIVLNR